MPAAAQDAWVSPKERPTAVDLGDRAFDPQGNLRLFDGIRVHPSLRETITYDDNIFLTDKNRVDDVVSVTSAGLRLDLLPGKWEISAGGRFRWEQFFDNPKESHADVIGDLRINYIGRTFKFELRDTLENIEEPLNLVLARRLERVVNTVFLALRGEMARFGFDLELQDENWDFRKPFGTLDHRADTISVSTRLLVASERTLFLTYSFGLVDYFRNSRNDYQSHEVVGGLRGRLGAKLEGEAGAGWIISIVDEAAGQVADRDHSGPVGRAQLAWSPTPRFSLTLRYRTGLQFAQFGDYQVVDRGELSLEWRPEYEIVSRVFGYVENNDPPGSPPFLNSAIGTTFDWDAYPWLSIGFGAEYRWRLTDIQDGEYSSIRVWAHLSMYL